MGGLEDGDGRSREISSAMRTFFAEAEDEDGEAGADELGVDLVGLGPGELRHHLLVMQDGAGDEVGK